MTLVAVFFAVVVLIVVSFSLGRLYEAALRDQAPPERPADWAVQMARDDPQRLLNALRREELP